MNTKEKLKKLINLLGVPSTLETGFIVGGRNGSEIVDGRTGERTGYVIGGVNGQQIISRDGEEIGSVSVEPTRRVHCDRLITHYQIGGNNGSRILYVRRQMRGAS